MTDDNNDEKESLYDQMDNDDWALIIGSDGNLKGMFIPEGKDEEEVPYSIVHIMENYFGIDFSDNEDEDDDDEDEDDDLLTSRTIH
jgi:hypothetical protein